MKNRLLLLSLVAAFLSACGSGDSPPTLAMTSEEGYSAIVEDEYAAGSNNAVAVEAEDDGEPEITDVREPSVGTGTGRATVLVITRTIEAGEAARWHIENTIATREIEAAFVPDSAIADLAEIDGLVAVSHRRDTQRRDHRARRPEGDDHNS